MRTEGSIANKRALLMLYAACGLTGLLHAAGGALLPSIASTLRLRDSQSGLLLLLYFAGSSVGALLCIGSYARLIALGFAAAAACCFAVSSWHWPLCLAAFLFLGVSVGLSMSAVNLYVGREYARRAASMLALLNCTWGVGALSASLFAARVLIRHSYHAAYMVLGGVALCAAFFCWLFLQDRAQADTPPDNLRAGSSNYRRILLLALAAFLEVGVENLSLAWLSTYASRMTGKDAVLGATLTAGYWVGFLGARALAPLILLRAAPASVLRIAILAALGAAVVLVASCSPWAGSLAMSLLGVALGPVYPLIVAQSFADLHRTSDTRWVLGAAGFGGSVLPWLTGWISANFGGIRVGLLVLPAALLLMLFLIPMKFKQRAPTLTAQ